jgi:hypothetical protein
VILPLSWCRLAVSLLLFPCCRLAVSLPSSCSLIAISLPSSCYHVFMCCFLAIVMLSHYYLLAISCYRRLHVFDECCPVVLAFISPSRGFHDTLSNPSRSSLPQVCLADETFTTSCQSCGYVPFYTQVSPCSFLSGDHGF